MQIVLASSSYRVTAQWIQALQINPKQLQVAFITTAAEVYNSTPSWLVADRLALVEAGFAVTDYTLTGKTHVKLQKELSQFQLLFVTGGNTFYLLEKANQSGFSELLRNDFFAGQIYVGSSAGSVVLGQDLEPIVFLDDPEQANLTSFTGISLLDFLVLPHFDHEYFKSKYIDVLALVAKKRSPYKTLAEDEFLIVKST